MTLTRSGFQLDWRSRVVTLSRSKGSGGSLFMRRLGASCPLNCYRAAERISRVMTWRHLDPWRPEGVAPGRQNALAQSQEPIVR
jgi:hypothetical protein